MLTQYKLDAPIDEIYENLEAAENRLVALKYKQDEVKDQFYQKGLAALSDIKMRDLLDEHYKKYYSHLKSSKTHKSRLKVISETLIPTQHDKMASFAGKFLKLSEIDRSKMEFGEVPVKEYADYINAFITVRKQKVKNQTIVNDLMFIHTALKNCGNYFTQLQNYESPLRVVNFKELPDQVTYKEKRLKPEARAEIERILIESSRKTHYHNLFVFLYETGVRISEALSILVKDCDLEKGTIFLISKKNDVPRYIGITKRLMPILKEQLSGKKSTDRVFPFTKEAYNTKLKNIKPRLAEAGIDFSWHMTRHTFISNSMDKKPLGTLMNELDINDLQHFQKRYLNPKRSEDIAIKIARAQQLTPDEVKTAVGHGSLDVTVGTYTHQANETQLEKLQRENEALKKTLNILMNKI